MLKGRIFAITEFVVINHNEDCRVVVPGTPEESLYVIGRASILDASYHSQVMQTGYWSPSFRHRSFAQGSYIWLRISVCRFRVGSHPNFRAGYVPTYR
jgi:hypothetical protein